MQKKFEQKSFRFISQTLFSNNYGGEQRVDVEELFTRALGVERKYAGKLLTIASELIV